MNVRSIALAGVVAASVLAVPQAARADHNTCGLGHGFQYNAPLQEVSTGTVDSFDTSDFWHDTSIAGPESLRLITLYPVTGDTDLYVWNENCTVLICSSRAGARAVDTCQFNVSGGSYVEARNWGGAPSQYTLTVTYSPLFL